MTLKTILLALAVKAAIVAPCAMAAMTFDIDFTRSFYTVDKDDSFLDLIRAHERRRTLASVSTSSFEDVVATVHVPRRPDNHSVRLVTQFEVLADTHYEFQIGADWGRGGGFAIYDQHSGKVVSEQVIATDIWWDLDWNNSGVITAAFDFTPGSWRIEWIGFEECCGGSTSVRYAQDGGDFLAFNEKNFYTSLKPVTNPPGAVPLPASAYLFSFAIVSLQLLRKRGKPTDGAIAD